MKMDQYIGMHARAQALVSAPVSVLERGVRIYPDGSEESFERSAEVSQTKICGIDSLTGMFGQEVEKLNRFDLPDGSVYVEYLQHTAWSDGPCYFTALKTLDGQVVEASLWTPEEMAQRC
jgi:hypothetical protein